MAHEPPEPFADEQQPKESSMKKFLVLYRSAMSAKEQIQMMKATPEQAKASMGAWMSWAEKCGPALVDVGAPIGDSALLKGTAGQGHISGYSIVQAESPDAAKRMFDAHPHFDVPGASIEILELLSMPGGCEPDLERCAESPA